jgi:MFS superfamily sulfate permease-like transporter
VSVFHWVPGLEVISSYRRQWLLRDVIAGVVLTTMLVPQGMAYAELAGLPPITGLYTSILCLLGYAAFGPSRILVLGPDSSLGPMIAATILPLIAVVAAIAATTVFHLADHGVSLVGVLPGIAIAVALSIRPPARRSHSTTRRLGG